MNEYKVIAVLFPTFEELVFYVDAEDEDEAIQKVLDECSSDGDEVDIKDVLKISDGGEI